MSAPPATLGAPAPAAGRPARWFHHALQAGPQAVPDNLHGILAGGARGRLRALALSLRAAAGPVLVLASDDAALGPPPGIKVRDLDLRAGQAGCPFQQPAFRRLCEHAAGDLGPLVASCWSRIRDQDILPGCYRALTLHAGLLAVAAAQLGGALERCGLPAPIEHGGGLLCLVRSMAELRQVAAQGWFPAGAGAAWSPPGPAQEERERGLAQAFAAAREVHVPTVTVSLTQALDDADPVRGPIAAGRISAALQGTRPWRPWAAAVTVVTASVADAERLALVTECALAEAQAQLRRRHAVVRTLVIDGDLLVGPVQESGQTIARCGRKANCSCLVLAASADVPGWRDHAGFTIEEKEGRLWLATDQDFQIAIDDVVPDELIVRAHALLHRSRQGD
jgi:hypothetical protein